MIALLQRVSEADVAIDGQRIAAIGPGLMVLIGVERNDQEAHAQRILDRLTGYRVFADSDGKMNLSLRDVGGGLLLVPQFTLAADTDKGMRPSFSRAAAPEHGKMIFDYLVKFARRQYDIVGAGSFGADMQVNLTNDGPVTFLLHVSA